MLIKKLILIVGIVLIANTCFGAEFLIYNRHTYMDDWTPEYVNNLSIEDKLQYDSRYQKGDIIDVFPDGQLGEHAHAGGKFNMIKVVGLSRTDGYAYLEKVDVMVLRERIFNINKKLWDKTFAVNKLPTKEEYPNEFITPPQIVETIPIGNNITIYRIKGMVEQDVPKYRRKYAIDLNKITPEIQKKFDNNEWVELTLSEFISLLKVKE